MIASFIMVDTPPKTEVVFRSIAVPGGPMPIVGAAFASDFLRKKFVAAEGHI